MLAHHEIRKVILAVGIFLWAAGLSIGVHIARPFAAEGPAGAMGKSRIVRLDISSRVSPAFGGARFGDRGQYELLVGKAYGVADPSSSRNGAVTDLAGAPRNAQGLVEYSMDIAILKPIDIGKANGTLLYEVSNRGNKFLMRTFYGGSGDFTTAEGAGKGVGLHQGFMMVWSGWQGDLTSSHTGSGGGSMAAFFPRAKSPDGSAITGTVWDQFIPDLMIGSHIRPVGEAGRSLDAPLSYPPLESDVSKFKLTVRQRADDAPVTLPTSRITWVSPKKVRVDLPSSYDLGAIYEITYTAKDPTVHGLSFVSIRDFISFLRNSVADESGNANPLVVSGHSGVHRTIAIGLSQSGRYQRDFIYLGFNIDEQGRRVFDGMLPQGAGAKRGFFHQRFAKPGYSPDLQHEGRGYPGAQFPFTYGTTYDPFWGKSDGILLRCTETDSCPKIMHIDSDWEQWQQAASLVMTDPLGRKVELPPNVRAYYITGSPHSSMSGIAAGKPGPKGICEYNVNTVSWAPVLRALVFDMEAWLMSGTEPPPTRYPADASEGRVSIDTLRNSFPSIPGYRFSSVYGKLQLIDFTQDPPVLIAPGAPYHISVLRVNGDGNPFDGVVMPEISVPIAKYSGRTTRAAGHAQGDLCVTWGQALAFPVTRAERIASGDPRLSIEERYSSETEYQRLLREAAELLVSQRLMLPIDAAAYDHYRLPIK
jgi:hypothetical protein